MYRLTQMADSVENLILDLLEWLDRKNRTYSETMDAWRTSCPRLPVWEDASGRGLVETVRISDCSMVRVTKAGRDHLKHNRPEAYEQLQRQRAGSAA